MKDATRPPSLVKHFDQQSSAGDTVYVIIAVDSDILLPVYRLPDAVCRLAHVRQKERIGEVAQARIEETFDRGSVGKSAGEQNGCHGNRQADISRKGKGGGSFNSGGFPGFHN